MAPGDVSSPRWGVPRTSLCHVGVLYECLCPTLGRSAGGSCPRSLPLPLSPSLLPPSLPLQCVKELQTRLGKGHPVYAVHGGLPKAERSLIFHKFEQHPHAVLVATDIVARGLDLKGLPFVISMYLPSTYDAYVHRIGRTGRAGAVGETWALFEPDLDSELAYKLKEGMRSAGQTPPPELDLYIYRKGMDLEEAEARVAREHGSKDWVYARTQKKR